MLKLLHPILRLSRSLVSLFFLLTSTIVATLLRFSKGKHLTLFGFYGASNAAPHRNIGDNAILLSMLTHMEEIELPKLIFVMNKEGKYNFYGEEFEITARGWARLWNWLPIIARTRVFVMGGGGMLQDYLGDGGTTSFLMSVNLLFRLAGRKIMWYSSGIGPLASRKAQYCTLIAAKSATIITVRDRQSMNELMRIGVAEHKITATSDPVFRFVDNDAPKIQVAAKSAARIGISILPFYRVSGRSTAKDQHVISVYRQFILEILDRGYEVALLAFDNQQDLQMIGDLASGGIDERVEVVGVGATPAEMLSYYRSLDMMLGMRFHSLIFGLLAEVPTGIVIYHPKVKKIRARKIRM